MRLEWSHVFELFTGLVNCPHASQPPLAPEDDGHLVPFALSMLTRSHTQFIVILRGSEEAWVFEGVGCASKQHEKFCCEIWAFGKFPPSNTIDQFETVPQ